jgi:hypothetical protein
MESQSLFRFEIGNTVADFKLVINYESIDLLEDDFADEESA